MREYNIRVLTSANRLALSVSNFYFSDFVAIRAAQNLSRADKVVQVWRGENCIYHDNHYVRLAPDRPAT